MDLMVNAMAVPELIDKTNSYMTDLGYSKGTMRHFREAWNVLKKFASTCGQENLTSELGMKMLKEHYDIDMYSPNLSGHKSLMRRSVMLLLEFQLTGKIAKHMSKYDHAFPSQYAETGERFMRSLTEGVSLSPGTLRNYHLTLEKFFNFAVFHGAASLRNVDTATINAYMKTLAGYAKSYIAQRLRMLTRFFSFAYKDGALITNFQLPTVTVYEDRTIPEYYTDSEIKMLLGAVDRANARGKRDYAMLLVAVRYGLRVSDIKAMTFSNIDFGNNIISITQQKTCKPLTMTLLSDVGWAIIDYIKNGRPQSNCPNIFIRHVAPYETFGSTDNLDYLLRNYAREAGFKTAKRPKSSFHMLRYSLASDLLRQGISLTTISGVLGHSEINTTSKYTRLDFNQLRVCALEVAE